MATCYYCLGRHETSQCRSKAADRIVEAQDRGSEEVTRAIAKLGHQTLDQLMEANFETSMDLGEIRDAITGLAEMMWAMEEQTELLTGIHDMIKNPRATQADELYQMGADSFARGRLKDSLDLLGNARDLNPGDYRVLITLGHCHARMDSLTSSADCFGAAADYARASEYVRDAALLQCRALRALGRIGEAAEAALRAVRATPNDAPAQYALASCLAGGFEDQNALPGPD